MEMGRLYSRYLEYGTPLPVEAMKSKNAEDVLALMHIVKAVRTGGFRATSLAACPGTSDPSKSMSITSDLASS